MTDPMVPITRPALDDDDQAAMAAVLRSGFLVQGPQVSGFERELADLVGVEHAVAVANCTAALEIALRALGIGSGDLVVVAPYSWVATANVIELCGATPIFTDIDPDTFNMSAVALEETLNRLDRLGLGGRVKALMPVHTFGNTAGYDGIAAVAAERDIPVVEDAACALGATSDDRQAGSLGRIGCFSFHPRKIITTGEGGMLVTDDDEVAAFARAYRNHGQSVEDGSVVVDMPGANLRLTDIQGALGRSQLRKLDRLIASRTALAAAYDEALRPLGLTPQRRSPGAAVQSYVVATPPGVLAVDVIARLRAAGVEATVGTNAIPFLRYYERRYRLRVEDLPVTADLGGRAVTLPLYPGMSEADQARVVEAMTDALR